MMMMMRFVRVSFLLGFFVQICACNVIDTVLSTHFQKSTILIINRLIINNRDKQIDKCRDKCLAVMAIIKDFSLPVWH